MSTRRLASPRDEIIEMMARVRDAFGIDLTDLEAQLLYFLDSQRLATMAAIDADLWPDDDRLDRNAYGEIKVLVHRLRKKMGDKIELENFPGQGYRLNAIRWPAEVRG